MPGWTFQTGSISLRGILRQMGTQDPFDSLKADFSDMADAPGPLFISDVVHKAFVAVDEEGTEAAAATGVIIGTTSVPPPPIPFAIDRPFVYLIRDIATETIVFMGRVTDPR
jgi:serpin B